MSSCRSAPNLGQLYVSCNAELYIHHTIAMHIALHNCTAELYVYSSHHCEAELHCEIAQQNCISEFYVYSSHQLNSLHSGEIFITGTTSEVLATSRIASRRHPESKPCKGKLWSICLFSVLKPQSHLYLYL